jgi:hypothetical protein
MLRFHGRWSLAAVILCASLAQAGSPTPAKKADDDKIMTLTDNGKSHRCQILKSYKTPSGDTAYEVRDLESGEIMTVIENPAAIKAATTPAPAPKSTSKSASKKVETVSAKTDTADPIMDAKKYNSSQKVQKQLADDDKSASCADKSCKTCSKSAQQPNSAAARWFSSKPKETKPAVAAVAVTQPIEAIRHPDPVIRLIGCLRDDMLPSMREVAAETLAHSEARSRPEVMAALQEAAEKDPAPSVRACCARCISGQ